MNTKINPATIQDESGILRFKLENHEYSLNVNIEEERERIKEEVNSRSKHLYDWFKEDTGNEHWVLYDTEMYTVKYDRIGQWRYLNYRDENALAQIDGALVQDSTTMDNPADTINASPAIPINATSCRKMFYGCKSLENIDLSGFDTRNIVEMRCMFMNCKNLKQLDLSGFSTGNVCEMTNMFFRCSSLEQVNLSGLDTHNVEYMGQMFYGCKSLKQLDLSHFNTEKVVSMQHMFTNCSELEQLNISNFDTRCTSFMDGMFWGCLRLTNLDISSFDMGEEDGTRGMFGYCSALKYLKVNHSFSQMSEIFLPEEVKIIVVPKSYNTSDKLSKLNLF